MSEERITRYSYNTEIDSIVDEIKSEVREYGGDVNDRIHETVDGHQWVIYYAYNEDVLRFSDHEEYGIEEGLIDAADAIKQGGLSTLKTQLAYWAMYADVCDKMDNWEPNPERDFIKVGAKVKWNDPCPIEGNEDVIWTVYEICGDIEDDDTIVKLTNDAGGEAEVLPTELEEVEDD